MLNPKNSFPYDLHDLRQFRQKQAISARINPFLIILFLYKILVVMGLNPQTDTKHQFKKS